MMAKREAAVFSLIRNLHPYPDPSPYCGGKGTLTDIVFLLFRTVSIHRCGWKPSGLIQDQAASQP